MKRILFLPALISLLLLFMAAARTGTALSPVPTPTISAPETVDDTSQVEQSILAAIAAHKEQVLGFLVYQVKIGNIHFSGDHSWATAWLGMVDAQTGGALPIEPGLALAQREGEGWRVTLQSDPDWLQVIDSAPKDLMGDEEKSTWRAEYEEQLLSFPQPAAPVRGYLLPWAKGEVRYLSQSVAHDAYTPSGTAHFAFDFYLHEQLWRIYAAKAGTVWKFYDEVPNCYILHCDQPLGNYIVLKDETTTPTTYQLYLHLAYHSIPPALRTIGAQVVQGQFIGIADNTGQSWGDHLHYQVHTNPNSYWGSSIDITFDDVAINGGRPRVRAYDPPYCRSSDICYNYSDSYVSGNTVKGDITLPYGDLTKPQNGNMIGLPTLDLTGWANDNESGFYNAQLVANYNGSWHDIGPLFTAANFSYSWDMCASNVPDGVISAAIRVSDREGNQAMLAGLKHFTKNYACPQPPTVPDCIPGASQVSLYADRNYSGECMIFNTGVYTGTRLGDLNNNAASIKVGANVYAGLYRSKTSALDGEIFMQEDADLSDNRIGADRASQLSIQSRTTIPLTPALVWPPDGYSYPTNHAVSLDWEYPWKKVLFQAQLTHLTNPPSTVSTGWQSTPFWSFSTLAPGNYVWQVHTDADPDQWSTANNLTITTDPTPSYSPTTVPYTSTFESGAVNWTTTGLWRLAAISTPPYAHSGTHAWWFGESVGGIEQYQTSKIGDLTSPPITIPVNSQKDYYLRFYYRYQTETEDKEWDQRWVQISKDNGPYADVFQLSDDLMGAWLHSPAINLSSYEGHSIRLRFHFDTMDLRFNTNSGWFIDDVGISADAPPACASGGGEPNNTPAQATTIAYGQSLPTYEICPGGDLDYYKFTGNTGDRVVVDIDAQTINSPLDSMVYLLGGDGKTVLAYSDDEQSGLRIDPHLSFILPSSGVYYLKVRAWNNPDVGGSAYFYHMRLFTDAQDPAASITFPSNGTFLNKNPVVIQVNAQDLQSGISHVDFYWHSDSWLNSDWVFLGSDTDGKDGWSIQFDPGSSYDQSGAAFYVHVYDWAGNWIGAGTWNVSFDSTPPVMSILPIVTDPGSTAFQVVWIGADALSGLDHVDLQLSIDDNQHWQDLVTHTPSTGIWYAGQAGHSYYFQVRGTDRVGNTSAYSSISTPAVVPSNVCTKFDAYDTSTNDNTVNLATLIVPGISEQIHNFCNPLAANRLSDTDWVRFNAERGEPYVIEAIPLGSSVSAAIDLFDSEGAILLKHASPIRYGAPTTLQFSSINGGLFTIRLSNTNSAIAGSQVAFLLRISDGYRTFLPRVNTSP